MRGPGKEGARLGDGALGGGVAALPGDELEQIALRAGGVVGPAAGMARRSETHPQETRSNTGSTTARPGDGFGRSETHRGRIVNHRGRKYLTREERTRFLAAMRAHPKPTVQTLARTLALTGCRVSEALAIRACDIDLESNEIRIATLKRRRPHWRAIPVPAELTHALDLVHRVRHAQASPRGQLALLWTISRQAGPRPGPWR